MARRYYRWLKTQMTMPPASSEPEQTKSYSVPRNGFFVTFEGGEGGGKSTQIKLLHEYLRAKGHEVTVLREPGGTPIGEEIRNLLKHSPNGASMFSVTELLLMNAARAQLVQEVIRPALEKGNIVLCDRFYDSTTAYQGYGRGLNLMGVEQIIDLTVGRTRPDLTFLLDIPLEVSEKRRTARSGEPQCRFEQEDRQFFERVQQGFYAIQKEEPGRVRLIDANRSVEEVQAELCRIFDERYGATQGLKS